MRQGRLPWKCLLGSSPRAGLTTFHIQQVKETATHPAKEWGNFRGATTRCEFARPTPRSSRGAVEAAARSLGNVDRRPSPRHSGFGNPQVRASAYAVDAGSLSHGISTIW